ncbi:sugar transferase, partial [Chloroflexi bacterium TSY]|nr:sugar transferase [Chloroflexi bacterium TSY]
FTMYKFRTMRVDAEEDGEPRWADENDDRITKVGRWLRRTRLDELPQVFNILHGEMSLVGPRPERPEFVAQLVSQLPYYRTRHMVKPGLTGWAQVHYDYGNSIQDALVKLQYDFYYVRYWSILPDIYTIFRTIGVVFQLRGT